jgi:hypothetical protein
MYFYEVDDGREIEIELEFLEDSCVDVTVWVDGVKVVSGRLGHFGEAEAEEGDDQGTEA